MTANGQVTLSRIPDGATTRVGPGSAENGDKVEFRRTGAGSTTLYPNVGEVGLISTTVNLARKAAQNPLTGAQRVSSPDTGNDGVTFTHKFKATSAADGSAVDRLTRWTVEDNAPTTLTRLGRISQDDKDAPALNVTASATVGLKARRLTLEIDRNDQSIIGTLELVLDGDPASVGT